MAATKTLPKLRIRDFSGHLNLRDAQLELGATESPDEWNVTGDERGSVAKRLGYAKWNSVVYNTGLVQNVFYWASGEALIVQSGAELFLGTGNTVRHTFSTSARVDFCDFLGLLWVIHPVDGLFSSTDGTSYTSAPAGPVGSTIAVWQNQLWASGSSSRVFFSVPGSGTQWYDAQTTSTGVQVLPVTPFNVASTTGFDAPAGAFTVNGEVVSYTGVTATSFTGCTGGSGSMAASSVVHQGDRYNDLREKDDESVICLTGASGQDIQGRPGLLAFKRRSTYRIYDADTGAYTTVDTVVGAASALATTSYRNTTFVISERGLFFTDGTGPLQAAGEREEPLWTDQQIAYDHLDLICAGRVGERIKFSLPRTGETANNLAFEYHPGQGWLIPGSNAMSCYATYGKDAEKLLAGSPTVTGQVYQLDTGGSDDGADIASWYQTKFFEPADGNLARYRHLWVIGRGAFSLYTRLDYDLANDEILDVDITTNLGAVYDDAASVYDADGVVYGPTKAQDYQVFHSLGCAKAISFRIEETSSIVTTGLVLLGGGTASEVGAWGLYGLDLEFVVLGDV